MSYDIYPSGSDALWIKYHANRLLASSSNTTTTSFRLVKNLSNQITKRYFMHVIMAIKEISGVSLISFQVSSARIFTISNIVNDLSTSPLITIALLSNGEIQIVFQLSKVSSCFMVLIENILF